CLERQAEERGVRGAAPARPACAPVVDRHLFVAHPGNHAAEKAPPLRHASNRFDDATGHQTEVAGLSLIRRPRNASHDGVEDAGEPVFEPTLVTPDTPCVDDVIATADVAQGVVEPRSEPRQAFRLVVYWDDYRDEGLWRGVGAFGGLCSWRITRNPSELLPRFPLAFPQNSIVGRYGRYSSP